MRFRKVQPTQTIRASKLACAVLLSWGSLFAVSAEAGPWAEHLAKIPALQRETEALESEIKHLIHEKREAHDAEEVKHLTGEIAEKYKTLKEKGEKLEEETEHVRYKHPEQADTLDRKYVRFKSKSLGDLESEVGIDGKLDRLKAQVLSTFPVPVTAETKPAAPRINPFFVRTPASVDESTDVPEKIVLKK